MKITLRVIIFYNIFLYFIFYLLYLNEQHNLDHFFKKNQKLYSNYLYQTDQDNKIENEIFENLTFEISKILTKKLVNDKEKTIAVVKFMHNNFANHSEDEFINNQVIKGSSNLAKLLSRVGQCGTYERITRKILEHAGINSRRYSLYNFPKLGEGHTAIEVFFNNKYHYFDPTYGGYFEKDTIMSINEMINIVKENNNLSDYLIYFDKNKRVYNRAKKEKWVKVDTYKHMTSFYSNENIKNLKSHSSFNGEPMVLHYEIQNKLDVGAIDQNNNDLKNKQKNISQNIHFIGYSSGLNYFHNINFTQLTASTNYVYKIYFANNKDYLNKFYFDLNFFFEAESLDKNCSIIKNKRSTNKSVWEIHIKTLNQTTCNLLLKNNIKSSGSFLKIDKLLLIES